MAALTSSAQVIIIASASSASPSSQSGGSLSQSSSSSSRIVPVSPLRLTASSRRGSIHRTHAVATNLAREDKSEGKAKLKQQKEEEEVGESGHDIPAPTPYEIQSLLMQLCDETKIAELEIKMGSFQLHVRRDVGGVKAAQAQAFAPHSPLPPMFDSLPPAAVAAAAAPPPAGAAPLAVGGDRDTGVDEGLQYVASPRVGIFRRGRQVKGKTGKPLVTEGMAIKKGQVVCYLEQLGTQLAIESEHAGEVVKFLVEDGAAVGFNDHLLSVRPSFPGIKKLAL